MCLNSVTELGKPEAGGEGYKLLIHWSDSPEIYGTDRGGAYVPEKTYSAMSPEIKSDKGDHYMAGFHIFLTPEDAKRYSPDLEEGLVYRVTWKHQLARGTQWVVRENQDKSIYAPWEARYELKECVVAQFMTIHERVDFPKPQQTEMNDVLNNA